MYIGLLGYNSVEYVEVLIDIWNNGDCAVLLDCSLPYNSLVNTINECHLEICYIDENYFKKLNIKEIDYVKVIKYSSSYKQFHFLPSNIYMNFKENYSHKPAIVIFSSGTTGKSKGIVLSHYAINTNADMIFKEMEISDNDKIMIIKKISHSSTLVGEVLVALKNKLKILLGPIVLPSRIIIDCINIFGITILCTNPILLKLLTNEVEKRNYAINLKKIFVSGDRIYENEIIKARNIISKAKIYNMYGLTECGPRVFMQNDMYNHLNSVGVPLENVHFQIKDLDGNNITKSYRKGVVFIKTPCVALGYINTKFGFSEIQSEWINTKDIGYLNENGELFIVGRADDLIIIAAHKIYPNSIEEIITKFTNVKECVVTTCYDYTINKEVLCCFYVGEINISSLLNILSKYLIDYEIPKKYFNIKKIPRNANGKIDRKFVKENWRYLELK